MRITRHPLSLFCLNQGRPPPASPLQLPVENLAQSRCLTGVPGKDLYLKCGMCTTRVAHDSNSDFRTRRSLDQFSDANLDGANLTGANLTETFLQAASLVGANLTGANLTKAVFDGGW